jgi:predicted Zn-dependent peptidase
MERIDMPFHRHTLPNGLQLIGETNPAARSVGLGFFVRTGARDETPEVSGVTHFLEHMIFKGTPHRSALQVNADFDRIGADYNAFTSEENTVFHAAVLPEYLPQAVDILSDILRPSLREDDFTTEKEVIINEIGMYDDRPGYAAYDQAKQLYFAGHPLGQSILGTKESIRALARDQMYEYFARRYGAGNILVAAAGHFDWDGFVALIEQHCGGWEKGSARRQGIRDTRGSGEFAVRFRSRARAAQEYVILISPGPAAKAPLRYAADVLAMILGDDTGSRLYWALVDPGLADSADASYHEYEGTGSFYVSLSCEPERTAKNLQIIQGLLRQVQQEGITQEELRSAQSKILARVVRGSERPMGRLHAIGMSWTYQGQYRTVDEELAAFEAVNLKKIREVLDRYPFDRVTTLALGPLEKLRRPRGNGRK